MITALSNVIMNGGDREHQVKIPDIIFGAGSRKKLPTIAAKAHNCAFIITDRNLRSIPEIKATIDAIAQAIPSAIYDDLTAEPKIADIDRAGTACAAQAADLIIAIGGGSVIDTAKGAAVVATCGGSITDYQGRDRIPRPLPPIIAVPTTAGTGSEATPYIVAIDDEHKIKTVIASDYVLPQLALCDPELTLSMPPHITAATGLDALAHAIESFISLKATPYVSSAAISAIITLACALPRAVADGSDIDARGTVLFGSLQAGIALGNASTTIIHGLAHTFGAHLDLPHGQIIASLLPEGLLFMEPAAPLHMKIVTAILSPEASSIKDAVTDLISSLGIAPEITCSLSRDDLSAIADQTIQAGIASNSPRPVTATDLVMIMESVLAERTR